MSIGHIQLSLKHEKITMMREIFCKNNSSSPNRTHMCLACNFVIELYFNNKKFNEIFI